MSLVFAGIVPHSPITLPNLHQAKGEPLPKTSAALKDLEGELYVMQPDTLFIISPHAPVAKESFTVNLAPQLEADFEEFGDATSRVKLNCDIELISRIRELADRTDHIPVHTISEPVLDYGTAVAAYHLTHHLPNVHLVPISIALLDQPAHYRFGQLLQQVAMTSNKRVAILASTALAHSTAPAANSFDHTITELIRQAHYPDIMKLTDRLITEAQANNAVRTLSILFGALTTVKANAKILAYEQALGVGYVVAQFSLI